MNPPAQTAAAANTANTGQPAETTANELDSTAIRTQSSCAITKMRYPTLRIAYVIIDLSPEHDESGKEEGATVNTKKAPSSGR